MGDHLFAVMGSWVEKGWLVDVTKLGMERAAGTMGLGVIVSVEAASMLSSITSSDSVAGGVVNRRPMI